MASFNRVIIMGNLTRDPEYKQLASGQAVCRLGLACNRQFKNRQTGEMVQEVCFVDIDVWGYQAESCNQYLSKGRNILVEGRLKLDTWQDDSGQRRSKHSIVADRVTFLSNAATDNVMGATSLQNDAAPAQAAPVEPSVSVDTAPAKTPAKKAKTGEVDFKDQEPFEDDLPF